MVKKLPLTDFRAVRCMLEPEDFAISEGQDVPPSDLIEEEVWGSLMHLPEDVSIRISDHNGTRLALLHSLWSDWVQAIGDADKPDEIFNCLLDAADCLQCANFNLLHGFYRAALAELRTALELVMIGTHGSRNPNDKDYCEWKSGIGEWNFTRCRRRFLGSLRKQDAKWLFEEGELLATSYQAVCNYTHSRPDASDGALWQSNGPIFKQDAILITFKAALSVYAMCYLLIRLARPNFIMPEDSDILFELDWMPDYAVLVRAYSELYGKAPRPPLKDSAAVSLASPSLTL
jgi:hypothetical protein